jgi:CrcB protein
MRLHPAILVGIGGANGTIASYLLSLAVPGAVGIMAINLSGALVLGWLLTALKMRGPDDGRLTSVRLFAGTGILGGYTTYSTFAFGSAEFLTGGSVALGIGYAVATVVFGTACAVMGIVLGRRFPIWGEKK